MLDFLLEEELSEHEATFGIFVDCGIIDACFDGLQLLFVSEPAMEFALSFTAFVGLKGLPDSNVGDLLHGEKG